MRKTQIEPNQSKLQLSFFLESKHRLHWNGETVIAEYLNIAVRC